MLVGFSGRLPLTLGLLGLVPDVCALLGQFRVGFSGRFGVLAADASLISPKE